MNERIYVYIYIHIHIYYKMQVIRLPVLVGTVFLIELPVVATRP